jgi:hypothetical protein
MLTVMCLTAGTTYTVTTYTTVQQVANQLCGVAKLDSTTALSFSGADFRLAETQPLDVRFGGSLQVIVTVTSLTD